MADLPAANTLNWHGNNTLMRRSKSQFLTLQMWVFFPISATLLEDDPMAFIISTITTRLWFFQNPQNSWHDLESSLSKQGYLFSDSFLHMIIPTVVLYDANSGFTTIAQAFDSEFLKLLLLYLSLYPSRGLRCFCDCLTDMHHHQLGLWSCKPVFLSWRSFSIVHVWGCNLKVVLQSHKCFVSGRSLDPHVWVCILEVVLQSHNCFVSGRSLSLHVLWACILERAEVVSFMVT